VRTDRLFVDVEALGRPRAVVLEEDVGLAREVVQRLPSGVALEVEFDALLAVVDRPEVRRFAVDERRARVAIVVADAGPLDFDYLRP